MQSSPSTSAPGVFQSAAIRQRTTIALSVFAALLLAGFLFKSDDPASVESGSGIAGKAVDLSAIDQASQSDVLQNSGTEPSPSTASAAGDDAPVTSATVEIMNSDSALQESSAASTEVAEPAQDAPPASASRQLDAMVSNAGSVELAVPAVSAEPQNTASARPHWQSVESRRVFTDDIALGNNTTEPSDQSTRLNSAGTAMNTGETTLAETIPQTTVPATLRQSDLQGLQKPAESLTPFESQTPPALSVASARSGTRLRLPDSIKRIPYVAGILQPDGFRRAHWQKLAREPALDSRIDHNEQFVVILDPGHGGFDPGSVAENGLMEKNLTLDIAKRVRAILQASSDIQVEMTRTDDSGLDRQTRVKVIRESQANAVVSIHLNHLPQPDLNVVESFYAGPRSIAESRALLVRQAMQRHPGNFQYIRARRGIDVSFSQDSKRLATALHNRILSAVRKENKSSVDAGVREETLFVLTRSYKTGALVELTCLSNGREAERLKSGTYRHRLAEALAQGIIDHANSLKASTLIRNFNLGA